MRRVVWNDDVEPVRIAHPPFRMRFGVGSRPTAGEGDRHLHADLMARFDLTAKQIDFQVRVRSPDLRGIVAPSMMTLREDVDLVDPSYRERFLLLFVAVWFLM